ncbi:MAG: peptidase S10 [Dermatophilaceae bacterium]
MSGDTPPGREALRQTETPGQTDTPGRSTPAASDPSDGTPSATSGTSASAPEPEDDLVTTRHTLRVGRTALAYTAVTGRMVLREEVYEDGAFTGHTAKAQVSLTAYTLDDADPTTRPVTFAFNGGPGSSSVWLHLGLLGPRRVVMGDVGALAPPPYAVADNPETLLRVSDLVFVDPISTGYSRAVKGGKPAPYHGFQGDLESVAEVIRLWTTRNRRWMSPKLLAGESYGTLRAAALAEHLQTRFGMYLNGVILVSSVLDLGSIDFENQRNDRAHANYLSTYAAIAHYHGKHGRRSLASVLAQAQAYAARDYPWALSQGARLSAADRATAVATVAKLTGLSADYVDRADLRIEHWRFFGELLRDQGLTVGRLDGRFTAPAASGIAEAMDADCSLDAITGPYAATFNHYVRAELGYENDLHYEQLSDRVQPWSYRDFEGRPVDVSQKLERAMRQNPHLLVHVAHGRYDGATPPGAAEEVFARLHLPESLRANIDIATYPAGHMMYVHEPSRVRQSADLADFVRRAARR